MQVMAPEMALPVERLRALVSGSVLTPADPRYDQMRRGWNLSIDQYPALILVADDAADVAAGVQFARANQLGVAVQSTGHGLLRPANDALLIITSRLTSVSIDPDRRTARVEAGVIWQHVLDEAAAYGLAPLLGSSPYIGVVGYTLGGGMGWLARKYGLAADSVRAIEIVTPDGVQRHASATENAELFWGLRGGGGNFGVVTALEISLYPVATVYGGTLTYAADDLAEALRFFRSWICAVPDELTASLTIMKYPDLPQVPEPVRGKTLVMVKAVYAGDAVDGAALMQGWLDWRTPLANSFTEIPFNQIGRVSNDPVDPMPSYGTGELLDDLSDEAIEVIVGYTTNPTSPLIATEIRHGQGAVMRAAANLNAIGNREAKLYLRMSGITPTPEASAYVQRYLQGFKYELKPALHGGMYLNFMGGDDQPRRSRDAYSTDAYYRLRALKAYYDPQNLFRFSFNIPALTV